MNAQFFAVVALSALSAYLYYLGGEGQKLYRRLGIPLLCSLPALLVLDVKMPFWAWIVTLGLEYAALTTYCSPDDDNVIAKEWAMTGALYGLSNVLVATFNHVMIFGFVLRIIGLALFTMVWSVAFGNVKIEASGRGAAFTLSKLIYLLSKR